MPDNPTGRFALITGASSGIGEQFARMAIAATNIGTLEDLASAFGRCGERTVWRPKRVGRCFQVNQISVKRPQVFLRGSLTLHR